eukprot:5890476-Prymnesium_polylepis.2
MRWKMSCHIRAGVCDPITVEASSKMSYHIRAGVCDPIRVEVRSKMSCHMRGCATLLRWRRGSGSAHLLAAPRGEIGDHRNRRACQHQRKSHMQRAQQCAGRNRCG